MKSEIRDLNVAEISAVAGGYDEVPYCGTVIHHWPFPPRPLFGQLITLPALNIPGGP